MHPVLSRHNVHIWGDGTQPMLFAHGFGCDQNMWRRITPAFEKDYKIIVFDYVGSGRSDLAAYVPAKYRNLQGYADDILEICETLQLKDIVFVGHSVSSMIGLLAANKAPELFARLIFVGPSARYIDDDGYIGGFARKDIEDLLETMDKNYIGWANFLGPAIMKNEDRPELARELTDSFCSTDPVIARQFAEVTFYADNRKDLVFLRVPSLILQCTDDIIAPLAVGEYLHRQLPRSTLAVMKATGHCPHVSAPEETTRLIRSYLTAGQANAQEQ